MQTRIVPCPLSPGLICCPCCLISHKPFMSHLIGSVYFNSDLQSSHLICEILPSYISIYNNLLCGISSAISVPSLKTMFITTTNWWVISFQNGKLDLTQFMICKWSVLSVFICRRLRSQKQNWESLHCWIQRTCCPPRSLMVWVSSPTSFSSTASSTGRLLVSLV